MTSKNINYNVGALITILISVGVAAIIYGAGFLVFDPLLSLATWILVPLGAYTIVYALVRRKDAFYYTSWGLIMLAVGLALASYNITNPLIMFGALLIGLAIMGLIAYWRRGKVGESS
ncbi:MAG: hypothetical protein RMJ14_03330 [Nitrososphaerota archaeon]|nr:hypothetical protein [Aigarchaeota archaeon]MDW8076652.1 hypothetical protein [Nitrososphaerota archaeon]